MIPISIALAAAMGLVTGPAVHPAPLQIREGSRSALTLGSSWFGPTGLITIPTAYTAESGQARFSAFFGEDVSAAAVNYGVVPYVEVGGAFVDRDGADDKFLANAKVTLVPANFKFFEVGVGVIDAADAMDQTIYFVASADVVPPRLDVEEAGGLPVGFKVHAGAGTGMFKEKAFFGGELLFGKKVSLMGEWDTTNFNVGVRWVPAEHFSIQTGFRRTSLFLTATTAFRF